MAAISACGGETVIVVETVVVEKEVKGDTVVETVVVEKEVKGDTVVETVVVEKEVKGATVVETVIVEKEVKGATVVETVIVEKVVDGKTITVIETVVVEKEVVVEVTPAPPTATPKQVFEANLPEPKSSNGQVTVLFAEIAPGTGLNSAGLDEQFHLFGVGEAAFRKSAGESAAPALATGWELNSDLSGGKLFLREGVQFHGGYGEMTAKDIAYTINDSNSNINPNSVQFNAGDFASVFGSNPFEVVDDYTVSFKFATDPDGNPVFDPRWNTELLNDHGQSFSVQSTAVRDQNGEDWMRDNPLISTGPFEIVEWTQNDKGIIEPVSWDHWLVNPKVDRITFVQVPESTTQKAMMRTGEADIANLIASGDFPEMQQRGYTKIATPGSGAPYGIFFTGNLWEKTHALTGEPLDLDGVFVRPEPWIGLVDDPESMEKARLVRQALARGFDRDKINDVLLDGLGNPVHVHYFLPTDSRWDTKYNYDYDPDLANQMLDEAGYERDSNGIRFDMPFFLQRSAVYEVGEAIAGYWQELGINVSVLKYNYLTFRPSVVQRTARMPWMTPCDWSKYTAWDAPKVATMTSLTRGGYSCGVEDPHIAEQYKRVAAETDPEVRSQINDELLEYMHNWALNVGAIQYPAGIWVNPKKITSWPVVGQTFAALEYEFIEAN